MADAGSRRRVLLQGWGVLLSVPAIFLFSYFYSNIPYSSKMTFCSVRHFLGVDCPGCGLTRSFVALIRGDIRGSVDIHPLGLIIAAWLVYMFFRALYACMVGRWPKAILTQGQRDLVIYVFLFGLIVQWIAGLLL
jgi:uncharacterized protein DUF2752